MKYKKAQNILLKDVLDLVQKYIDGDYIYIPKKDNSRKSWVKASGIKAELNFRIIKYNIIGNTYLVGVIKMKKIENLNIINDKDMEEILDTWEAAVRATHSFLSEEDIISIKPQVKEGVKYVSNFLCIRDNKGIIKAFIGINDFKIEMLFVSNDGRGNGIGKRLVEYAIEVLHVNYVDVNEQNPQGTGFYKYMGFEVFKKSDFDEQGNPFPILHMKLK